MNETEKAYVEQLALQIFMKKMPTTTLTNETMKGFTSSIEQSFEIAKLFAAKKKELLEE